MRIPGSWLLSAIKRLPRRALVLVIELYRHTISPLRLASCRFMPTCSEYAVDALNEYGLIRGSGLTAVRLAKCGPWCRGGWDPIPERHSESRGSDVSAKVRSSSV